MLSQACQRCWRRKQKCSRQTPKCSECERVGARCIPRVQGRIFGDLDQDQHHIQPTGSFIEYMKQRISYLERQANTDSNTPASAAIHGESHDPAEADKISDQDDVGQPTDASRVNNPMHQVEYLSLSAMSGSAKHLPDGTDGSMTAKFIKETLAMTGIDPGVPVLAPENSRNPSFRISNLESQGQGLGTDSLRSICQITCSFLGLCYPYVSTETCLQALEVSSRVEQDQISMQVNQLSPEKFVLLSLTLSTGFMILPQKKGLLDYSNSLVAASNALLPEIGAKATEMFVVRSLTAQTILSLYNPMAGSTWHLLGLALTKAISIGLHRQNKHGERAEQDENDETLLFWTLYMLDRTIGLTMSRPFGIEDDDITLDLPDIPAHHISNPNAEVLRGLFLWKVHHARLLYGWCRESSPNLNTCLASCEYWRDIYKEVSQRIKWNIEAFISTQHKELLEATIRKDELQLSCRALSQLIDLFWQRPVPIHMMTKLREQTLSEIPQLLDHLTQCVRSCVLTLTFLDGYDIFAAAIIYSDCLYEVNNTQRFRLGIAQTRMIAMAIDLLQNISERFKVIGSLKEVIWGFLSALEVKSDKLLDSDPDSTWQSKPNAMLQQEIDRCEAVVPDHLVQLMINRLSGA